MNEEDIVQKGDPVLRKKAIEVSKKEISSDKIKRVITDMKKALHATDDGVAIAAPQIGISKRIFLVHQDALQDRADTDNNDKVFINPEIVKTSQKTVVVDEGCLSVRDVYGKIERSAQATIRAFDEDGGAFEMGASGLLAQIFQHETDHLDGVLFVDNASDLKEITHEPKKHEEI